MKRTPLKRKTPLRNKTKIKAGKPKPPRPAKRPPMTAELREHHARVRALGCILTGEPNPTIHHCHGGSMRDLGMGITKGGSLKTSDWLVIPLAAKYHCMGPFAIDGSYGVKSWEILFGTQVSLLNKVAKALNVNIWEKAGVPEPLEDML